MAVWQGELWWCSIQASAVSGRTRWTLCLSRSRTARQSCWLTACLEARIPYEQHLDCRKNKRGWIWFIFAHSCFLRARSVARVPPRTLSFGFGIALENPRFITCYDVFEKLSIISTPSRSSRHTFLRSSFCSLVSFFWNQLCTNLSHTQLLGQNVVDGSVTQIQLTDDHSDCQTPIRHHYSPHFGHIFVRFWPARSSRTKLVFHYLTAIQKWFIPHINLCPRYSMHSINPF